MNISYTEHCTKTLQWVAITCKVIVTKAVSDHFCCTDVILSLCGWSQLYLISKAKMLIKAWFSWRP